MAQLIVRYGSKGMMARLPRQVWLNGRLVGIMQQPEIRIMLPAGAYDFRIAFGGPLRLGKTGKFIDLSLSSSRRVEVSEESPLTVTFSDRERLWNILFDIDLLLWIAEFFITLPEPWNLVYKILSDAFFAIWLLRIIIIRKRYYKFDIS